MREIYGDRSANRGRDREGFFRSTRSILSFLFSIRFRCAKAAGDAGSIQRRRTIAADALTTQREMSVVANVGAGDALVGGETGAQQAGGERMESGDANGLVVQRGAWAAGKSSLW